IGKFNALREQRLAEKITDAQLADAIEREVIPPWEALHHRLDEVAVPSEMESLDRKIKRLMTAREAGWRARIAALRDPTEDKLREASERSDAAEEALRDLNDALKDAENKK